MSARTDAELRDEIEVDCRAWLRYGSDVVVLDCGREVFRSPDLDKAMAFAEGARERKVVSARGE